MVNLERTCILLFDCFLCLKVNLDLEKTNQLGESSPNFIFAVVSLDPINLEKGWIDGESWPNDFVEKVNRGEDLRWVGSRCPLTRALMFTPQSFLYFLWSKWPMQNWKSGICRYVLHMCGGGGGGTLPLCRWHGCKAPETPYFQCCMLSPNDPIFLLIVSAVTQRPHIFRWNVGSSIALTQRPPIFYIWLPQEATFCFNFIDKLIIFFTFLTILFQIPAFKVLTERSKVTFSPNAP